MTDNKETKKKKTASESLVPKAKKTTAPKKQQVQTTENTKKADTRVTKKESAAAASPKKTKEPEKNRIDENSMLFNLLPYLLGFAGLFVAFCIAFPESTGFLGNVTYFFRGLLSYGVWAIPLFMFFGSFILKEDMRKERVLQKAVFGTVCTVFISVLTALAFISAGQEPENPFSNIAIYFEQANNYQNGGIIGGLLGILLHKAAGSAAIVIAVFVVLIFGLFEFGCTPADIFAFLKDKIREFYHDVKNRQRNVKYVEKNIPVTEPAKTVQPVKTHTEQDVARVHTTYKCNRNLAYHLTKKNIDVDIDDKKEEKRSVFDEILYGTEKEKETEKRELQAENVAAAERDIAAIGAGAASSACDNPDVNTEQVGVDGGDMSDIFADGAVIAAGGMSMTASVLDKDVIDTSEGERKVSEVSDTESVGFEVESGKLTVGTRPPVEEMYEFPSPELLKLDPNPTTFTVTDELKATATKLVETLMNFGVRTKITNISCGPTVTRYELQPEIGVRVKAIQNLADDIALHLAASGVRIEAPIPGKNAVGIEVPNKTVSTVYIRNLIENPQFRNLKSRISCCLGMDIAGSPVYMDIGKMPHILIAGATGMGKSVCINSIIISILYKSRPDEVKFILVDPKKVEFSMYKGIPHLLVPVVNDPKKAAGALAWAVSEMERRFSLIEEVGVRDITGYNEITKNDPEKPKMSHIIIIIDELADLMMTAKDEVENSICRLAQKARAAGMHLVIGTQRPSVDVITGLIKANIPSRIACTVASQTDSRTIIDIAGAEKLIGRGDMLFAPVGSLKPIRVQGSFVSDAEVEAVTDFLRSNFNAEYDKSIIDDIEREAAKCGEKKKGRGADSGDASDGAPASGNIIDSDEMIMPAIQVAVSAGQLSTSLLQRKLSLGYARAARIVDILEQMGVVSGFEGSKPRRVLITEDQYLELKMRQEGGGE